MRLRNLFNLCGLRNLYRSTVYLGISSNKSCDFFVRIEEPWDHSVDLLGVVLCHPTIDPKGGQTGDAEDLFPLYPGG